MYHADYNTPLWNNGLPGLKPRVARRHRQVDYPAVSRKNSTHASRSRDRDLFRNRKFTSTLESVRASLWCIVLIGVGLTELLAIR